MDNKLALRTRLENLSPEQRAALLRQISSLRQKQDQQHKNQQQKDQPSAGLRYPLSQAQRRLWVLSQIGSEANAAYNISSAFYFDKPLTPERLQRAWRRLLANHEVLRSSFVQDGNELYQVPREVAGWTMPQHKLAEQQSVEAQLLQLASAEAAKPFDLQQDWLLKAIYCETDAGPAGLVVVIHHSVCDGLSIATMISELAQYYKLAELAQDTLATDSGAAAPALQYRDYVEFEARADTSKARAYWKNIFASAPDTLDTLFDLPRPVLKDFGGSAASLTLAAPQAQAFEVFCHTHNATLFMGLVAMVQLLLAGFANTDEVTLGTPVAGRPGAQFGRVVGPFVNTIALRQTIDRNQTFAELLLQVRRRVLEGFQHQGLAFDELVTELGFAKDPNRSPLYDVMLGLTFADEMALSFSDGAGGNTIGRTLQIPLVFSKVDLTFHFEKDCDGSLRLDLEYATGVLLDVTARRLCEAWRLLIVALPQQPSRALGEIALHSEEDQRLLLEQVNATARPYPHQSTLVSEFRKSVQRCPDAVAVHAGEVKLSYQVLDELSDQVAKILLGHRLHKPGCRIALMLDKDERALIVILGILKSRGVYVPLAANTPMTRVRDVIAAGEVQLVFAEASRIEELQSLDAELLDITALLAALPPVTDVLPLPATATANVALDPAYLMFTSGSTGKPKGTLIEQRAVLRLVCNTDYHQVRANERVLLTGSLAFDAATFEIWGPLLNGGCVCIPAGTTLLEVHEFHALVDHYQVDTAFLTTGLFNQLVDNSPAAFGRLQTVLTGGEKISVEHVRKLLLAQPAIRLLHVYGPTENTTFSTWHQITMDDLLLSTIPIGRPIANSRVYLLDQNLRPVPIGVPGEIYCGGDGIARGYIEQQDAAGNVLAAAFLVNPFLPAGAARLYRTGDLAKWNHKRELIFLGRNDRQVKIRGFRVELGEVEYHLRTLPGVMDAFVQARGAAGSSELVAWLVAPGGTGNSVSEVREVLKGRVPNYMMPAKLLYLERLPLNASGKVDVQSLPLPEDTDADSARVGERHGQLLGKAEQDMARLYAIVLGLNANSALAIDRDANFFSLGGDSIRAIQLVSLARSDGYHFTLKDIFASETLAGLAAAATVTPVEVTETALRTGPLSPTQLWWLDQCGTPDDHFNLSSVFKVTDKIDMVAMRAALDELLELHPVLRLTLDITTQQQNIGDKGRYVLREVAAGQTRYQCWQELQEAIDLQSGILLAVGVANEADTSYLAIVVHHLAADEVSGRLFAENLARLYHGHVKSQRSQQPIPEALGIINWAAQIKTAVESGALDHDLGYWQDVVARGRQILHRQDDLFADTKATRGRVELSLSRSDTATLLQLGADLLRMTPQELLLASFVRAWQHATKHADCLLSLEGHGREIFDGLGDCSSTMGWFTSLYPFVVNGGSVRQIDLYREVKDLVRRLPTKGFTYLPLRFYKSEEQRESLGLKPLLSFNYLGESVADQSNWLGAANEQAGDDHGEAVVEPFQLDVLARIIDGQFELTLRGQEPRKTLNLVTLVNAWATELGTLSGTLRDIGVDKVANQGLLSLSDSLVAFVSLAELDNTLAALQLPASGVEEILPLTGMQAGMWLHCVTHTTAYQDQVALRLQQPLDEVRFASAVRALVTEIQALRTGFAQTQQGELLQIVFRQRTGNYQFIDHGIHSGMSDEEREHDLSRLRATLRNKPRDLLRDPLFNLTLARLTPDCFELIIDFHHMALDGWTSTLLLQRLEALYFRDGADLGGCEVSGRDASSGASNGISNAASGMRRYFEWLGRQAPEQARDYWQRLLGDYQGRCDVPAHLPRIPLAEPSPLFVETRTGAALQARLTSWCERHGVTINATVQALWGVFLGRQTGSDDLVFGATVSGRDIDLTGVSTIAGMLINTLPVRIRAGDAASFAELVRETAQQFAESMSFGHLTLAEIQTLSPARAGLVTHALVFENYPGSGETAARWSWQPQEIFDPMHFEFGLIVAPLANDISFRFVVDGSLYLPDRLEKMGTDLCALLTSLLDARQSFDELIHAGVAGWSISANFTANSLAGLLQYHEYTSGNSAAVTLLPYDQSAQELINPDSRLRHLQAQQHVVLWRPLIDEDGKVAESVATAQLAELAAALSSFARTCPNTRLYVVPCPWLESSSQRCDWSLYREFTAYLKGALAGLPGAQVLSLESLGNNYQLAQQCYPPELIFGDIPYSEEFFAALANKLARVRDLQTRRPVKVYVVDADDTLWGGIVGEEGAQGIRLESVHIRLQQQLVAVRAAGALVCLATKNNETDVRAVFEQREMPLRWTHLTRVCAGWRPKSESILALADELSLGLDSFVFIDDSPLECEQVLAACPGVRAIHLPSAQHREVFLGHLWLLDAGAATREDAERAQMYADELQRATARKVTGTYAEFLDSLNIRVDIQNLQPGDLPRTAQLSQRTNQFNTTGIRYSEAELSSLLQEPDTDIRCISVTDKYGDYGMTGGVFIRRSLDAWTVFGLMLSCRVLGRGVEHAILRQLAQQAKASGVGELHVEFVKLARNTPALQFLQGIASVRTERDTGGAWQFNLPVGDAVQWQPGAEDSAPDQSDSAGIHNSSNKTPPEHNAQDIAVAIKRVSARVSHYYGYLASKMNTGAGILNEFQQLGMIQKTHSAAANPNGKTLPATHTEWVLAEFFTELLAVPEVFREDAFHDLGGHSLKAMMLFSRIAAYFALTLDFRDLLAHPTLAALAARIDSSAQDVDVGLAAQPTLQALPPADSFPVSPGQSRLWMVEHIRAAGPSPFHMHATLTVDGSINRPALNRALEVLFRRHEALRTCFQENAQGALRQVIVPVSALNTSADWFEDELDDVQLTVKAQEQNSLAFDLSQAPLVRIVVGALASGRSVIFITMHHIISDGWSTGVFSTELSTLYQHFSDGRQLDSAAGEPSTGSLQFRDFASWQLQWLKSAAGARAAQFWREHFGRPVEALMLPAAAPRPAFMQSAGASVALDVDKSVWTNFKRYLSDVGASDFTGLFAAVQLVLSRLSGQQDFCIGTAVAGRQHPQLESVIGFFVNILPLRTTLHPDQTGDDFMRAVASEVNDCLSHQGVPFDSIVSSLDLVRDPGRTPLFDVLLVLQNTDVEDLRFGPHVAEVAPVASLTSQYDLTINVFPAADGSLRLLAEYARVIYSAANIELILRCVARTMTGLAEDHDKKLAYTAWIDESDVARVKTFERVSVASKIDDCEQALMTDMFRQAAVGARGKISDTTINWSYTDLEHAMQRIAALLRTAQADTAPSKKQTHIGVIGKRSVRSVAAMLGVMDAGAVYVPLDLTNPLERLLMIIEEGAVDLLLSTDEHGAELANNLLLQHPLLPHICVLDTVDLAVPADTQGVNANREVSADDVAYMIFTSGSTGKPKGVQISHAAFIAMIRQQILAFYVGPNDVCGQFAALSFDASLSEIFLALGAGASLVMAPDKVRIDTDLFMKWLSDNQVTVITLPPVFLRTLNQRPLGSVRVLVTAGEAAIAADMRHYASSMHVLNAYGPTETSVCASVYRVQDRDEWPFGVPIGAPLSGVLLSVRDATGMRVPIGATGELCIGGPTLGQGYYGAPELTSQKFITLYDDAQPQRWYRSGDLVRWRDDGLLEFLGRVDTQVKVRGYRIEPGEIEQAARQIEGIDDAHALVHPQLGLLLYCVTCLPHESRDTLRLRVLAALGELLPRHMIPGDVVLLDAFPLSSAGKIERAVLLTLACARETPFVAPETDAERLLAHVWQRVLKAQRVGRHDDFFALGGDSIKALEVINALRKQGYSCELKDFFASPSLTQMADMLATWHFVDHYREPLVGNIALLPVQSWFLRSRDIESASHFSIVTELAVSPKVSENLLRAALTALIRNHDSLRACFYLHEGRWVQDIKPTLDLDSVLCCYRRAGTAAPQAEQSDIEELACRPFELATGPLLRCVLVQGPDASSETLVLALHHLVADWVSLRILITDLEALTRALLSAGTDVAELSPPHLLHEVAQMRAGELALIVPAVTDVYRNAVATMNALAPQCGVHKQLHTLHLQIPAEQLLALRELLRRQSAQHHIAFRLQDLLLATVLSELGGLLPANGVPLLVEGHGRDDTLDLARQVAWLTRARLYTLDTKKFQGLDGLVEANRILQADAGLQPDVFACIAADPAMPGALPALISFNYLGEFSNSQHPDDLFVLIGRVFDNAMASTSPVDVPLHIEFYVVDYALEIQVAWSPEVYESEALRAGWDRVRSKLAS